MCSNIIGPGFVLFIDLPPLTPTRLVFVPKLSGRDSLCQLQFISFKIIYIYILHDMRGCTISL